MRTETQTESQEDIRIDELCSCFEISDTFFRKWRHSQTSFRWRTYGAGSIKTQLTFDVFNTVLPRSWVGEDTSCTDTWLRARLTNSLQTAIHWLNEDILLRSLISHVVCIVMKCRWWDLHITHNRNLWWIYSSRHPENNIRAWSTRAAREICFNQSEALPRSG